MKRKTIFFKCRTSTRKAFLSFLAVILVISAGYLTGSLIGDRLVTGYITGRSGLLLLLSRPGFDYLYTAQMLNSNDGLKRLEGYYGLIDTGKIDADFLKERFRREEAIYHKRTIIWLMGFSEKSDDILKFLSREYKSSGVTIKREILRSMKRVSPSYFKTFVKDRGIDEKFIESI